jgi:RND family efflux transporter MFP subunit
MLSVSTRWIPALVIAGALAVNTGCNRSSPASSGPPVASADRAPVKVAVVRPKRTTLALSVSQPGRVQAFEQTPIYPKISGYVQDYVDIDEEVKEGQTLATLFVPERVEELKLKDQLIKQSEKALEVAEARVQAAAAQVKESQAGVSRAEANHESWRLEYGRISKLTGSAVDDSTKDQTWNQLQSAKAGWSEMEAKVESAKAALREREAARNKAQVDIAVAKAERDVAATYLNYAKLLAPFNGIVTRRNFNKGDFVQPPAAGKGEPLFVVERRDKMRVFVEVPESDSAWVKKGAKAVIRVPALQGQEFPADVTRTSYSLDQTTRTLLAEIDLPNPQDQLRSNMYAFAVITAERPDVLAVPSSAILTQGEITSGYQSLCFLLRDGKAVRTRVNVGRRAGQLTELLQKQKPDGGWDPFSGNEEIIANPPANLADGQAVEVVK